MNKIQTLLVLIAFPMHALSAENIDEMVKKYDKMQNSGANYKTENDLKFVDAKDFNGGGFKVKDNGQKISGNVLSKISDKKEKNIENIYYIADKGVGFVGFDKKLGVGYVDIKSSESKLATEVYDFGIKIVGTKCYSFFNVKKSDENLKDILNIGMYRISGITDYLIIDGIVKSDEYYGFYNNVSCSFYDAFYDLPAISTSVSLEYKDYLDKKLESQTNNFGEVGNVN